MKMRALTISIEHIFWCFLLLGGCIFLFHPSILHIFRSVAAHFELFHGILIALIVGIALKNERAHKWKIQLAPIHVHTKGSLILIIAIVAYLLSERWIGIHAVSNFLMLLGAYGLLSFFIPPRTWSKNAIPFLLVMLLIPSFGLIGNLVDTYLGFPLRIITAHWIAQFVEMLGASYVSSETILIIENEAMQVDVQCSGVRSLWYGCIFFLAVIWLEPRRKTYGVLALGLLFSALLVAANTLRILMIVWVHALLKQPDVAAFIHRPIGVIGFIFCCMSVWWLMKKIPVKGEKEENEELERAVTARDKIETNEGRLKDRQEGSREDMPMIDSSLIKRVTEEKGRKDVPITEPSPNLREKKNRLHSHYIWQEIALGILMIGIGTYQSFPSPPAVNEITPIAFEQEALHISAIPLTQKEALFFQQSNCPAYKFSFDYENLTGSFLVAGKGNWRSHHHPKLCLQANGLKVGKEATFLLDQAFPIRWMEVKNQDYSACYWFQHNDYVTEDYAARIWSEISGKSQGWVMVSMLFDKQIDWNHQSANNIMNLIRAQVYQWIAATEEGESEEFKQQHQKHLTEL